MLKSITLALVLASAVAGISVIPAEARTRTTAAECQALYDQSRLDPQSYRNTRDEYIACVSNL
jgi:hypothetical protein